MQKTNPIETAVAPMKADAIANAEQNANSRITAMTVLLHEAGNDLNVVAPYPANNLGKLEYMKAQARYYSFRSVTKSRDSVSYDRNSPVYADMDIKKCEKFVEAAKKSAAEQYDRFVEKLVAKIGDTNEAFITGNHVWGYSILTVTLPNGLKEFWKTQQIENVSKLGNYFDQWPSRKMKGAA